MFLIFFFLQIIFNVMIISIQGCIPKSPDQVDSEIHASVFGHCCTLHSIPLPNLQQVQHFWHCWKWHFGVISRPGSNCSWISGTSRKWCTHIYLQKQGTKSGALGGWRFTAMFVVPKIGFSCRWATKAKTLQRFATFSVGGMFHRQT